MLINNIANYHKTHFAELFTAYADAVESCKSDIDYRKSMKRELAYNTFLDIKNSTDSFKSKVLFCLNSQSELKNVIHGCMPAQQQALNAYEKLMNYCVELKYCYLKHFKQKPELKFNH